MIIKGCGERIEPPSGDLISNFQLFRFAVAKSNITLAENKLANFNI